MIINLFFKKKIHSLDLRSKKKKDSTDIWTRDRAGQIQAHTSMCLRPTSFSFKNKIQYCIIYACYLSMHHDDIIITYICCTCHASIITE